MSADSPSHPSPRVIHSLRSPVFMALTQGTTLLLFMPYFSWCFHSLILVVSIFLSFLFFFFLGLLFWSLFSSKYNTLTLSVSFCLLHTQNMFICNLEWCLTRWVFTDIYMHILYVHFIFYHHIEYGTIKLVKICPCTYMHTDLSNVCVVILPLVCVEQLTTTTTTTVAVSVSELSLPLPTLISYSLLLFSSIDKI